MRYALVALVLVMLASCASSLPTYPVVLVNGLYGHMIAMDRYYPRTFLNREISGGVLLHYSVDSRGRPSDIKVATATNRGFAKGAIRFMRDWRFNVPPHWELDGGSHRRFKAHVRFLIAQRPPQEKLNPNNPVFVITGWPMRTP